MNYEYHNFRSFISSRIKRKPIAYITGEKSFWKYNFEINEKTISLVQLILIIIFSLFVSILATLYPAYRASKTEIRGILNNA